VESSLAKSKLIVIFFAFFALVTFVHLPHLNNPFLHDDTHSIRDNTALVSLTNIPNIFKDSSLFSTYKDKGIYRPLLLTTYAINHAISGIDPWSWRLTNLLLLAANATLLVMLLYRWGIRSPYSVLAGLLFLLHPISGYCFLHVSTRSALLLAFFSLLGIAAHLRAKRGDDSAPKWIALSLICMGLGLISVSAAVVFPVLILLVEGDRALKEPKSVAARVAPGKRLVALYKVDFLSVGYVRVCSIEESGEFYRANHSVINPCFAHMGGSRPETVVRPEPFGSGYAPFMVAGLLPALRDSAS